MRLFDAIIDANHRALNGDQKAGLHLADYASELPIVALTCIDPRLNRLFPGVTALPAESFIWLRNAGNIIFGPLSSMTRSISLACAIKGGREIAIIGHTDCAVCHTTIPQLVEKFRNLGIERNQLPENLSEYFSVFTNERDNVIKSTELVRSSPIIGPRVPVQGLMVDVNTGRLEWVVNGYDVLERKGAQVSAAKMPDITGVLGNLADRIGGNPGSLKFPETKIGEVAGLEEHLARLKSSAESILPGSSPPPAPTPPAQKPIPVPPPIPNGLRIKRG
jgi:carbonic anhydrase